MIQRCSITILSVLLLGLTTAFAPETAEAGRTRRFIRVRYQGRLPYVRLYINGDYRATVRRGSSRSFYLRTRRRYRIRARYASRSSTKNIYLSPGSSTKIVTFYAPSRARESIEDLDEAPRKRYARLQIRYRGRKRYARCYIDGNYRGKIYRREYRTFRVRTGRYYTIKMKYASRTRSKEVYISRAQRSMKRITFYEP